MSNERANKYLLYKVLYSAKNGYYLLACDFADSCELEQIVSMKTSLIIRPPKSLRNNYMKRGVSLEPYETSFETDFLIFPTIKKYDFDT